MASATKKVDREKNQHIQVYVRCRPANSMEKKALSPMVVDVTPDGKEVVVRERIGDKELTKKFIFDKVFGPNSTQIEVYSTVAFPLIDEVLMGYNCTVFAYGQTGTGKTYTMQGCKSGELYTWDTDPASGIIPRTFQHLFDVLAQNAMEYNVRVSYLELYNEELFDLLGPLQEMPKLRLYEDSTKKGSVVIQGLTEMIVTNKDEVFNILERGAERRRVANTLMNEISSRSHTIFSITVHIKENSIEGEDLVKIGKFNLVDLAGSECIAKSGAVDKRAREAGNINQSLLTLGRVITALVEKTPHIPYRESKLTRLLQDSLGGRTKTSIIATVSPAFSNAEETNSTLDYAYRAKNITNKPEINQKMTKKALIREYTDEIERLRRDLTATREKNGVFVNVENYENMRAMLSNQSQAIKDRLADIEALKAEKEKITNLFKSTHATLLVQTEELEENCRNLDLTAHKLQRTQNALNKTIFEREEQKHLVYQQVKTEKNLSSQAQKLLQVAESSTRDLNEVFNKLDRKTSVETFNQRAVGDLRLTMTDWLQSLESRLAEFLTTHSQQLGTLQQSLDLNLRELDTHSQRQTSLLEMLTALEKGQCESTGANLNFAKEKLKQSLDEVAEWNGKTAHSLSASPVSFLSDCQSAHQALKQANQQQRASIALMQEKRSTQMTELSASLNSGLSAILQNFSTARDSLNQQCNKLESFLDQQAQNDAKDADQEMESFDDLVRAMNKYRTQRMESKRKVQEDAVHNITSVIGDLTSLNNKFATEWEPAVGSFTRDSTQKVNDIAQSQSRLTSSLQESVSQGDSTTEALKDKREAFQAEHQALLTKTKSEGEVLLASHQVVLDETLDNLLEENQKNFSGAQAYLEIQSASVQDFSGQTTSLLTQQLQQASGLEQWEKECRSAICSQLTTCQATVEHFAEKEIRVDLPTGLTPQRREYAYPRYLASTSPHDNILQKFRQAQDSSVAGNISIPASPVKGEDAAEEMPAMSTLEVPEDLGELSDAASEASSKSTSSKESKENKCHKQRIPQPPKTTQKPRVKGVPVPAMPSKKHPLRAPNKP